MPARIACCSTGSRPARRYVTDKNPYNYVWIGLIHWIFPRARIIHCRRHLLDTASPIDTTLFGAQTDFAGDRSDLVFYYRQYLRLMAHWRAVLPAGTILDLQYEDLIADPEPASRALIAFCGLKTGIPPACTPRPTGARCTQRASGRRASRSPQLGGALAPLQPWLGELRELLPDPA